MNKLNSPGSLAKISTKNSGEYSFDLLDIDGVKFGEIYSYPDAAHIVKCVNHFDELVGALSEITIETCYSCCGEGNDGEGACHVCGGFCEIVTYANVPAVREILKKVQAND